MNNYTLLEKRESFSRINPIYTKARKNRSSWIEFSIGKSTFIWRLQVVEILWDAVREAGWIRAVNSLIENRGPYNNFQQETVTIWFLILDTYSWGEIGLDGRKKYLSIIKIKIITHAYNDNNHN